VAFQAAAALDVAEDNLQYLMVTWRGATGGPAIVVKTL
jgi:hypothetical protein